MAECHKNPTFMMEQCAVACDNCATKRRSCDRPPDTPPVVDPGGINATMLRILSDFPQYSPRALSRPGEGKLGAHAPWVMALQDFISDEEAEAFISTCSSHFDRSLAGDQLSPVRTSYQCWCSSNACESHPLVVRVAERISNVTQAPVRYMEPFQVVRYEEGQFYRGARPRPCRCSAARRGRLRWSNGRARRHPPLRRHARHLATTPGARPTLRP